MNIVLTKRERDKLSVRKANARAKKAGVEFIDRFGGEWAVTVHFIRSFSERQKHSDFVAHVLKICGCLRNAIKREFYGRRSKAKILFIPVIEGLEEFKTTHLHLILGNLGTNNKQRVTKKLAYVFSKNKMVDVELNRHVHNRLRQRKSKNRIRTEALVTGELSDPTYVTNYRNKGMKVVRIYSKGWANYISKEQTGGVLQHLVDEMQLP